MQINLFHSSCRDSEGNQLVKAIVVPSVGEEIDPDFAKELAPLLRDPELSIAVLTSAYAEVRWIA